jgi:hypothetical protein
VTFFKPGSRVSVRVEIYGKNLGNGIYGQQDLTQRFVIGRFMIAEIDDNTKQMVVKRNGRVITLDTGVDGSRWVSDL